jgi:hypothetical protein
MTISKQRRRTVTIAGAATILVAAAVAIVIAALLGSPHRSQQATVERVRAYLEANRPFQHILTAGFDGRVLCGVYLWGTSASKHEIYAEATCGNYGVVNGAATQVSGYSTLVVLTTTGAPTTTSITAYKVPGYDEAARRDILAWFPPSIVNRIEQELAPVVDRTDSQLLTEAQSLVTTGQLPTYTPPGS